MLSAPGRIPDLAASARRVPLAGSMEAAAVTIRDVAEADASAISAIYGHHVLHGTASYEIDPPSLEETLSRIRHVIGRGWPFIVAEIDREVAGYAYATQFRDRAAYQFACENSIYVRPGRMGRGIGEALLRALMEDSAEFGFRTMVAVIGGAEPASIALHSKCGFAEVGRLKAVGWKKELWLDSVYMQRELPGKGTLAG